MQFTLSSLVTAALALAASAAPSPMLKVKKYSGESVPGSYIVTLKPGASPSDVLGATSRSSGTYQDLSIINGFSGEFDAALLKSLRGNPLVEAIEEDGLVHILGTQTDAAWGLGRISHTSPVSGTLTALNYTYTYSDDFQGQGVDIYIVDTGIHLTHVDFEGRATFGWSAPGMGQTDDHGHGSHVSGIAAGHQYGVAKQASLISVKVLNAGGSGTLAGVIGGFNYVLGAANATGKPSIASASLGGGASDSIDASVVALTDAGVTVVVAAGNSNVDAVNTSPARVPSAITVGAVGQNDDKAYFSNYGPGVDIWAPGVSITSSGYLSDTATIIYSGTSQATPHVSGLAALYLSQYGPTSPADVSANLWSQSDVVTGLPSGSINRLAVGPITI